MTNKNGAPSIFGAIPGAAGVASGTKRDQADRWWDVLQDAFEYAYDTFEEADLGWVPSIEQATDIRTSVVLPALRANGTRPHSSHMVERVQQWFERWHLYYPFVDQVAVQRAVDFHREAWEDLTVREHRAAIQKLATMHDPYEQEACIWASDGHALGTSLVATTNPRATRWMRDFDPKTEKRVLFDLVARWKRSNRGE